MKKILFAAIIALAGTAIVSCSSNNDDGDNSPKVSFKIHDDNIIGVWKTESDRFVSFSSDKFNSSLLSDKFIDEGNYTVSGDTIAVINQYFNNTTKYVVDEINDKSLVMTVTYDDRWDGQKKVKLQLTKSIDVPCSKSNGLVGKSFMAQYNVSHGSQHWNKTFTTYNSMSCARTDVSSTAPATFYYVYLAPKIYFYVIRNNMFYYDTVRYDNVKLNSNGQIEGMDYLYGQKLEL